MEKTQASTTISTAPTAEDAVATDSHIKQAIRQNPMHQNIVVLGATGSIGESTLDVVTRHSDKYRIFALTANTSVNALFELTLKYKPNYAVLSDSASAELLQQRLAMQPDCETEVIAGEQGLCTVASHPDVDVVMAAIVGGAGLAPTLAAVQAGKKVLLANKEALVMAGKLFMDAVEQSNAMLLPIDSEHNAIFQCMPSQYRSGHLPAGVRRILLTGSGGPFRDVERSKLASVTPDQACAHPNWSMGRKISVDSATMMNKGLELIEACWLFGVTPERVEIVVHPQSVIHSMVEYDDGSVLAQLGNPDMRTPIAHALAWPKRIDSGVSSLDFIATARLDFQAPDFQRFPCLGLAKQAMAAGGTAVIVLNAANEIAVDAFLKKQISFLQITKVIETTLAKASIAEPLSLELVKQTDLEARCFAKTLINELSESRLINASA